MPSLFFIGCTHFGHTNIITLASRPWAEGDVEAMDADMIQSWNEAVRPDDIVYHLGDFSWDKRRVSLLMSQLNGNICFLQGNHDANSHGMHYLEVTLNTRKLVLCHYPIESWNGMHKDSLHIHAHTHSHELISGPNRFNVCVEAINYRPINVTEILAHVD